MLKLTLFGAGSALQNGKPVSGFPSQQAGLLLCYLILNRRQPIPRERLAAVFWEDLPSATARKYLRNAIWRLKKMIACDDETPCHLLSVSEETIGLNSIPDLWIDVLIFEEAYEACLKSSPETLTHIQVARLEEASTLYTGDLLAGIYDDWTLYDRERFRMMYIHIRQKLMAHHSAFQRFEDALQHGEQILQLDPAREKIHRLMMRLHAANGDRSAALAQYKRCKQILKEELNLSPMKETRLLYRDIKQNVLDPGGAIIDPQSTSGTHMLQRLHRLQRLANRIHIELRSLEKLINQNLLDAD